MSTSAPIVTDGHPLDDIHYREYKILHPDMAQAAAIDIHPRLEGKNVIKFKEEILPLKNEIGGMRSLYSHNCELVSPNIVLDQGLEDIAKVFPALEKIDVHPKTKI